MISRSGGCKMPCESCGVQFSVFRRKRACSECERLYCAACLRRGGGMCAPCRALSTRPLARHTVAHLKARDLQCFLHRQNVSTRGCVEKEELVSLCVSHVNSAAYRRRGSRGPAGPAAAGPFTALKGLTNNFNEFLNSAFDLRPAPQPQPPPSQQTHGYCFNAAHAHSPAGAAGATPPRAPRERFTTRPGGEPDIVVPVPEEGGETEAEGRDGGRAARSASAGSAHVETADCLEVEDLDDAGWEFVTHGGDPLPNDSEVLMTATEGVERAALQLQSGARAALHVPRTPQRAASELELSRAGAAAAASPDTVDSASLQDEPLMDRSPTDAEGEAEGECEAGSRGLVSLEQVSSADELDALNVKQLKQLLARNRVEYRGCLERAELLERARRLWQDHAKYRDEIDNLPIEECCKICMAAPLECVLLECGHIATCTSCGKQLAECPICRQYVVRAVRFFRS